MNYTENENNIEFIKKQVESVTKATRVHINRIIALASMIEHSEETADREIVSDLLLSCYKLLSQNMNMMYLYSKEIAGPGAVISAEEFLKGIIGTCTKMLESVDLKLQLDIKCKRSEIKVDEKAFILAVMNLLQNALLNSPPNAAVKVVLENISVQNRSFVCISVNNIPGMDGINSGRDKEECSGLGIILSMKIAERYGGKFELVDERGVINAKLMFPLQKEDFAMGLSSSFADFYDIDTERYNMVVVFMQEVLKRTMATQCRRAVQN